VPRLRPPTGSDAEVPAAASTGCAVAAAAQAIEAQCTALLDVTRAAAPAIVVCAWCQLRPRVRKRCRRQQPAATLCGWPESESEQ
jgi:hypothetical protein